MTWLLVEDDPDIRNVVAVMMQLWGEKALALPDGNAAWTWLDSVSAGTFKGELPELALMDIRMPGHTGDQIAARIRETIPLKNIPIILMTAFTLTEAEVQAMMARAGVDHLVKKPLPDMEIFRSTLYQIRDDKRKKAAAPVEAPAAAESPKIAPTTAPAETPNVLPHTVVAKPAPTDPPKTPPATNPGTTTAAPVSPSVPLAAPRPSVVPAETPKAPPISSSGQAQPAPVVPSEPPKTVPPAPITRPVDPPKTQT